MIDAVFLLLMVFACIKGIRKGLIVSLFSIIAFIIGIAAALKLSAVVANSLSENVNVSGKWLPVISFIIVFLAVVILVNLGGRFIKNSLELVMLGWVDKIGGVILYIATYTIIFSIFLFYAVQLHILTSKAIAASQTYSYIQPVGPKVINMMGSIIPVFKDIFDQLERFFGLVSNKIQH